MSKATNRREQTPKRPGPRSSDREWNRYIKRVSREG